MQRTHTITLHIVGRALLAILPTLEIYTFNHRSYIRGSMTGAEIGLGLSINRTIRPGVITPSSSRENGKIGIISTVSETLVHGPGFSHLLSGDLKNDGDQAWNHKKRKKEKTVASLEADREHDGDPAGRSKKRKKGKIVVSSKTKIHNIRNPQVLLYLMNRLKGKTLWVLVPNRPQEMSESRGSLWLGQPPSSKKAPPFLSFSRL